MIAFLADENFNRNIVRGLSRRSSLDILIAKEVGLTGADDAGVLAWAGERGRIVLTHDAATMPAAAFQRLARGLPMPGLLRIRTTLPVAEASRSSSSSQNVAGRKNGTVWSVTSRCRSSFNDLLRK